MSLLELVRLIALGAVKILVLSARALFELIVSIAGILRGERK